MNTTYRTPSRARKTVDVREILDRANDYLSSAGTLPEHRAGVASLLEVILHETGNYRGYNLLGTEYAGPGNEPDETYPVLRKGFDDTRRHYYASRKLREVGPK